MSHRHDSILGNGQWDPNKPEVQLSGPLRFFSRAKDVLRPAILTRSKGSRPKLRDTAYLDGLRGFAAFLVFLQHHQLWIHSGEIFEQGFGYHQQYYFGCFPFIRLLFSGGHFAVPVFFVISGYVLSVKPLSLIQNQEQAKLADNVGSALFRRWLRLFIPVIVCTWIDMTSWHIFRFKTASPFHPERHTFYKDELWSWYSEFKQYSFLFRDGGLIWFTYNSHTWSIPVEFKGSVIIYSCLLAFSRCTKNARLWAEAALMFYFFYIVDGWYGTLFMGGMFLADLDLLAKKNELPRIFMKLNPYKELIFLNFFIIALYLGGVPSNGLEIEPIRETPGWYWLSFLKPQAIYDRKWAYLVPAAIILVPSIQRLSWLRRFFETAFCQYLGRISYSLYLVHGPILWDLGDRIYEGFGWRRAEADFGLPSWKNIYPWAKYGPFGMELGFIMPVIILLPITFWVAEIVTKLVDTPSITFSQWLYKKTLAPVDSFGQASKEVLNGKDMLT